MAGFDRVARVYRFLERVAYGGQLARARLAHLPALHVCRRILIVGDGDGRCLEAVLAAAPEAAVTSVDASASMLALARQRAESAGGLDRVTFVHGDIRAQALPAGHYDAALTMFVLDCFAERDAAEVVRAIGAALTSSGSLWLFADFALPARGWRRLHAALQLRLLYAFFRWETGIAASALPPSEALIAAQGFHPRARRRFRADSIVSVLLGRETSAR